jgi:hypothetical protein
LVSSSPRITTLSAVTFSRWPPSPTIDLRVTVANQLDAPVDDDRALAVDARQDADPVAGPGKTHRLPDRLDRLTGTDHDLARRLTVDPCRGERQERTAGENREPGNGRGR